MGGAPNPTIFNDLRNAPLYAQLNAPRSSMTLHSITLSSTAFGPIGSARGNLFAFGLHVETITGSSYEEALRFGGPPGNANRLFITVSP